MKKAWRDFINHPLMAPLAGLIKGSVKLPAAGMKSIAEDFRDCYKSAEQEGNSVIGSFTNAYFSLQTDNNDGGKEMRGTAAASMAAGAVGGAVLAGSMVTGFFATAGAGALGLLGGAVLAPIVVTLPVVLGLGTVASLAVHGIPGFMNGCEKAITLLANGRKKYDAIMRLRDARKNKARNPPPYVPPVQKTPAEKALAETEAMKPEDRTAFFDKLKERFAGDFKAAAPEPEPPKPIDPRVKEATQTPPVPQMPKKPWAGGQSPQQGAS